MKLTALPVSFLVLTHLALLATTDSFAAESNSEERAVQRNTGGTRVELPKHLPPHPRLFTNSTEIAELKAWIAREQWLKDYVKNYLSQTRERLKDITLPTSTSHEGANRSTARMANEFALAYVLSDDHAFAAGAAKILRAYVPVYRHYPVTKTKGKAMSSTLDETHWAVDFASAYDLIYNSGQLSDTDREGIEQQVLRPCGEVLRSCNHHFRSNWRARALAGMAVVGFVIDDRELLDEVLHGIRDENGRLLRDGFVHHVSFAVLADGIFYERSYGYQAYTADSYFLLMEAARHSGVDLWNFEGPHHKLDAGADIEQSFGATGPKTIKSIFDAMFYRTFSDGTVPVVANAHGEKFVSRRYFDAAWRAYRDPKFALAARITGSERPWAAAKLSDQNRLREPLDLLRMAPDMPAGSFDLSQDVKIGVTGRHEHGCTLFPNGGYAVLRQSPDPDSVGVSMTFGRYGSGHSHPDKLSIVASNGQRKVIREVNYFGYSDERHLTWDKQTIAHNTVTVDEISQAPQVDSDDEWAIPPASEIVRGRPRLFYPGEQLKAFRADCKDAYKGVIQERTVALVDSIVIDFFRCRSAEQHTYDYALHVDGALEGEETTEPGPPSAAYGYRHISTLRRQAAPSVVTFEPDVHLSLLTKAQVTTGQGIRGKSGEQRSILMARQEGSAVDFVTVISFGSQPAEVTLAKGSQGDKQTVVLPDGRTLTNTVDGITLSDRGGRVIERAYNATRREYSAR
ncbi:MAG: heparinase II/III family protein [Planctomycetales bacterium]